MTDAGRAGADRPAGGTGAGRTATITGAGAGIGRAIALRLAAEGYAVVVSDIDGDAAGAVAAEIRDRGGRATSLAVDANSPEDNRALVRAALDGYGRLDAAVNNAGLGAPPMKLAEVDDAAFDRAVDVTLRGTFHGMRAQLGAMAEAGGGAVVNIASIGGLRASRLLAPYIAAKHGVVGLTQVAALDYADRGIRVNTVAPGPIRTASFATLPRERQDAEEAAVPVRRLGEPADVAAAVAWLLSAEASFITGAVLPVDGGSLLA